MQDRFDICYPITAKWEGGWSDHKADPGGKTMYGVTEASWHGYQRKLGVKLSPVRNITKQQALTFYKSEFWNACGAPNLFAGVDLAVFDASVNSGVSRGRKWLIAGAGSNDHSVTVRRICRARLSFMQSLKIWKTFGKGWGRRVADIEAKGVMMALEAMGVGAKSRAAEAKAEEQKAATSAKTTDAAAKTSAGGGVASGGTAAVDPAALDWATIGTLAGVAVALAVLAAWLIARSRADKARGEAYAGVAA